MKSPQKHREDGDPADYWLLIFSAIGSVVVVYLLFFTRTNFRFDGKVVGVLKTDAEVRRRHERSLGWEEIGRDENLFRKDIVYTPKDTSAFIEFGDHRKIQLEPDSMIQLDDVTREQIQITLFSGKVKGDVQIKAKSEWESRVQALLGKAHKPNPLREVVNVPIRLDRLEDFDIKLEKPTDEIYNLHANRWLPMRWSPLPVTGEVEYQLDVAKDPQFSTFLTYKTKHNELSVQFDDPGTYYWRVRAAREHEYRFSNLGKFKMSAKGGIGNRVVASLPSSLPEGFTAELSTSANFNPLVFTRVVSTAKCPEDGLAAGVYFCRVTSVQGDKPAKKYRFVVK